MFKKLLPLYASAAVLAVSACSQPHSFPTGYTHHNKTFRSATPPPSEKFTDEQRVTMTAEQAEQFRRAVYSLAESLTLRAGMPPKPVYILRPENMSAFYSNIDNNLHESLRHLGYNLADTPNGAYVFTYTVDLLRDAKDLKNPDGTMVDPATLSSNNVRIALQVHDGVGETSRMLTEEAGTFYVSGAELLTVPFGRFKGVQMPSADTASRNFVGGEQGGSLPGPAPVAAPSDSAGN